MKSYLLGFILMLSCITPNKQPDTSNQGVKGKVLWLEGNFMPGPGQNKTGKPISRDLYFYKKLNVIEVEGSGPFYQLDTIKPVKTVTSNENGEFLISLPVGTYSVFSKEEKGFFSNTLDGLGNIGTVNVDENEFTEIVFKIDYKAAY